MKSLINKIIEMDAKADKRILDAKIQKDKEFEKINAEIEDLKKSLRTHAEERISRFKAYEFGNAEEAIAINSERNHVQKIKLDETYNSNHKKWEDLLFKRVLEGE